MTCLHIILGMPCIPVAFCHVFIVSSPPSLSIDLDVAEYDYVAADQVLSAEQPGKQNPLEHNISPTLFFLILALEMPCYCSDSTYSDALPDFVVSL